VAARTVESPEDYLAQTAIDTVETRRSVPCVLDVAYGAAPLQKLDIYHPRERAPRGRPVIMDVHGGGWHRGSKNSRGFPAATLTPKGFIWVPIDYRLAPASPLPDIVDDIRAALAWIHKNIADYGGDPERITVTGHSAGAQLAAMVLVDGWHGRHGVPTDVVKGCCLVSGVFDIAEMVRAARGYHSAFGITIEESHVYTPHLNPPRDGCPVVLAYGGDEPMALKRQSHAFADAWRHAGLPASLIECAGDHHFSIGRTLVDRASELNRSFLGLAGA
jgi:arylformamidase